MGDIMTALHQECIDEGNAQIRSKWLTNFSDHWVGYTPAARVKIALAAQVVRWLKTGEDE